MLAHDRCFAVFFFPAAFCWSGARVVEGGQNPRDGKLAGGQRNLHWFDMDYSYKV